MMKKTPPASGQEGHASGIIMNDHSNLTTPQPSDIRLSANLGFLWAELPLPEAIRHAAAAGFDAVECHFPYQTAAAETRRALEETGLPMIAINTSAGDRKAGQFGLAALAGQQQAARAAIDQAMEYANAVAALHIHVMPGIASGAEAEACFVENLDYACSLGRQAGISILIEPICSDAVPGYFLANCHQAEMLQDKLQHDNLKMMLDCFHAAMTEGADWLAENLPRLLPSIGHIQFAGVPDRGPPDRGLINYSRLFGSLSSQGYHGGLGAEYRPMPASSPTEQSLGWMPGLRAALGHGQAMTAELTD